MYLFFGKGLGINAQLPNHQDMFYDNRLVMKSSNAYANYACTCTDATCPVLHDNHIYSPDGKMDNVCGKTLAQRQADGIDVGTFVKTWPSSATLIAWGREVLDLPERR